MKTATKSFRFTDAYGGGEVIEGERIADDHPLVREFPECWRAFGLDEELKVRSDRVAELRERASRPAGREPVSQAGREERKRDDFWRSTIRLLEDTGDRPSAEERREAAFYTQALDQIEDVDTRELADVNTEAERAYGFDRGWARRVTD